MYKLLSARVHVEIRVVVGANIGTLWGANMTLFRDFKSNEDGHFAIMFAVTMTAVLLGTAAAIDVAGMQNARAALQDHIDSATLAAVADVSYRDDYAATFELNDQQRGADFKDIVVKSLETHGVDMFGATPNVTVANNKLMVDTMIPYELKFGGLLNKPTVDISAKTEVALPGVIQDKLEIALVLDNTESMNFGGKMTALRQGARDFITRIEEGGSGSTIAIVPFARYVDVGVDKRDAFWLNVPDEFDTDKTWLKEINTGGTCHFEMQPKFDDGVETEVEVEVCTGQTTTYEERHTVVESRWIGCVGVRSNGLHLVDDTYSTEATRIQGLLHEVPTEVTGFFTAEQSWCADTVEPLTDDYVQLRHRIGGLYGTDRTYIPAGLIWGQRLLSPQEPFAESTLGERGGETRQVMILMSDGNNTAYLKDNDTHESIPYVEDLNQAQQADGTIPPNTNEETAALCERIKAEGTEIYTVAFQVEDDVTHDLLRNCASSPDNYFDAGSNASLIASFGTISTELETEIRIVR